MRFNNCVLDNKEVIFPVTSTISYNIVRYGSDDNFQNVVHDFPYLKIDRRGWSRRY